MHVVWLKAFLSLVQKAYVSKCSEHFSSDAMQSSFYWKKKQFGTEFSNISSVRFRLFVSQGSSKYLNLLQEAVLFCIREKWTNIPYFQSLWSEAENHVLVDIWDHLFRPLHSPLHSVSEPSWNFQSPHLPYLCSGGSSPDNTMLPPFLTKLLEMQQTSHLLSWQEITVFWNTVTDLHHPYFQVRTYPMERYLPHHIWFFKGVFSY